MYIQYIREYAFLYNSDKIFISHADPSDLEQRNLIFSTLETIHPQFYKKIRKLYEFYPWQSTN